MKSLKKCQLYFCVFVLDRWERTVIWSQYKNCSVIPFKGSLDVDYTFIFNRGCKKTNNKKSKKNHEELKIFWIILKIKSFLGSNFITKKIPPLPPAQVLFFFTDFHKCTKWIYTKVRRGTIFKYLFIVWKY